MQTQLGRHVPSAVRRRAFELSAGNPLLLRQLAATMEKGADVPDAAGAGMAVFGQDVVLSRFAGLPPEGMRCAQAASVLGSGFLPETAAQIAGLKDADVDPAIEALARTGLIEQRPGASAEFVHPLFRQALYDDLPGPVRSRLHARAFGALHVRGLDAQAAEHAVRSGMTGDPAAIAVLEEAGRAARRDGAMATAVSWLDRAAMMAGDRASARLLMDLAEAHLVNGGVERAIVVYRSLLARSGLEPAVRVEARWMLARALAATGQHDRAVAAFEDAAGLARDGDPATALEVLLDAAYCAWLSTGAGSAMLLAGQARDLARTAGAALQARADTAWAVYALQCGDPAGIAAAQAAAAGLRVSGNFRLAVEKTAWRGGWGTTNDSVSCALGVEQFAEADRAFTVIRAAAEETGAPWAIGGLAISHSYALMRMGRLDEALAAITAAGSLTDLVPLLDAWACAGKAYVCLYMGNLAESARLCERVEAIVAARGQLSAELFLWDVLGHRRLREGPSLAACAAYDRLGDIAHRMGIKEPCLPRGPGMP